MKLRYYLRGLGIGIVVTALIFTITSGEKENLSDAEIRERAAQLGMVDGSSLTLAAIQTPAQETTENADQLTQGGAESESGKTDAVGEATQESGTAEEVTDISGGDGEAEGNTQTGMTTAVSDAERVTVTIQSGSSSLAACRELEAAGLIEDAEAFDTYLCNMGYSRSVKTGVYKIIPGTSEEEIAEIITKKR